MLVIGNANSGPGELGEIAESQGIQFNPFFYPKEVFLDDGVWLEQLKGLGENKFIVAGGSIDLRVRLYQILSENGLNPADPILHSSASISPSASIGKGSSIGRLSSVGSKTLISENCLINRSVNIGHDVKISPNSVIGPGVTICGFVEIGERAFVGAGSTILPGLTIGEGATVGAGSVVVRDVPNFVTVLGNPAKPLKPYK